MLQNGYFICHSCDKKVEYIQGEPPCKVLSGWFLLSQWKGQGTVEHYPFCSLTCLNRWVATQVPQVPEVFLKAFEEGEDK